ncbi:MAG: ParB/RepB/Spo0J family partition protein [Planctomycetaceae bacterium]|nr:ParB/RepB/Spo0J family partition protein [Planctomycetaceae bacterium]
MNKERRLGRGLEALLGQLPARNVEQATVPHHVAPQQPQAVPAQPVSPPLSSADAMFWLDAAHAAPGQAAAQPHHAPAHAPLAAAPAVARPEAHAAGGNGQDACSTGRINVRLIDRNPAQPRQEFDAKEMQSLAESISTHGLLQPVVVRRVQDRYQLVAGERRLRAAIQAGWTDVPVSVVEADDRQMAELAIVENLQRKDLNALEKAASFQKYLDQYKCTQEELAGRLKLDRSTIANLIRLLELPNAVQDALRRAEITQGHARALLPLGDEREQVEFCRRIQREGLNVRQTEAMVQETIDAVDREPLATIETPPKKGRSPRAKSEQVAALEQEFRTALGMKVKITHNARGRGKLVVLFRNHEEFERLKKQICG